MMVLGFQLYEKIEILKKKKLAVILFAMNYVVKYCKLIDVPQDLQQIFKIEELFHFKNEDTVFRQILKPQFI